MDVDMMPWIVPGDVWYARAYVPVHPLEVEHIETRDDPEPEEEVDEEGYDSEEDC